MAPSCAYLNGIEVKIEFNHTGVSRQSRKCTGTTIVSRQATHATGSYRDMSAQNRTFAYRPEMAIQANLMTDFALSSSWASMIYRA